MESQLNVTSYGDVAASVLFVLQVFLYITCGEVGFRLVYEASRALAETVQTKNTAGGRGRLNPSDKIESPTSNRAEKNNFGG